MTWVRQRRGVRQPRHPSWVFKGTRLPVATVIENLEDLSIDEIIEQFEVTREQVTAVLEFVAESLRAEPVPTSAHPL